VPRPGRPGLAVAATLLVLVAGTAAFIYSGAYDVSATSGHTGLGRWVLKALQKRSIAVRADGVPEPPAADSASLTEGFERYHEMCVQCHGAPGVERGEIGRGIAPQPPDLAEEAEEHDPKRLFWVTKHGVKLAGMPAFGPTHTDEEVWAIVRFLERLPGMRASEYARWVERHGFAAGGERHGDAPGTASRDR